MMFSYKVIISFFMKKNNAIFGIFAREKSRKTKPNNRLEQKGVETESKRMKNGILCISTSRDSAQLLSTAHNDELVNNL